MARATVCGLLLPLLLPLASAFIASGPASSFLLSRRIAAVNGLAQPVGGRLGSSAGILGPRLASSPRSRAAPRGAAAGAVCIDDMKRIEQPVVIIGAGVAGMACALELKERAIPFVVVEASDGPGGRVRTDTVDGFLLDRGFQIFLTSYPEAQRLLNYKQLDLQPFYPGALVRFDGGYHRVADPFRRPIDAIPTLFPWHPIGSILDKILIGVLRIQSLVVSLDALYTRPDIPISDRLSSDVLFGTGFSKEMVDRFFRPFLGGIFFDNNLRTNARELDFVFRMLALGENCLPSKGIGAVSDYLAAQLPSGTLRLNSGVKDVAKDGTSVTFTDGSTLKASAVVVATEGNVARTLLSTAGAALEEEREAKKTTCLYYSIDGPAPTEEPILYLNGDGVVDAEGSCKINNMCFPSNVSPSYAPAGKTLVSVSLIGVPSGSDEEVAGEVSKQMVEWFGASAAGWKLLKVYRIAYCQPNSEPPSERNKDTKVGDFLFVAGDHRETASLNGALRSGTRCAESVSEALSPLLLRRSQGVVDAFAKSKGIDSVAP